MIIFETVIFTGQNNKEKEKNSKNTI